MNLFIRLIKDFCLKLLFLKFRKLDFRLSCIYYEKGFTFNFKLKFIFVLMIHFKIIWKLYQGNGAVLFTMFENVATNF